MKRDVLLDQARQAFVCPTCGQEAPVPNGAALGTWLAARDAFRSQHAACLKSAPAPQPD